MEKFSELNLLELKYWFVERKEQIEMKYNSHDVSLGDWKKYSYYKTRSEP